MAALDDLARYWLAWDELVAIRAATFPYMEEQRDRDAIMERLMWELYGREEAEDREASATAKKREWQRNQAELRRVLGGK